VNGELGRILKEQIVDDFKVVQDNLPEGAEETD
jgi:hypothetical protein